MQQRLTALTNVMHNKLAMDVVAWQLIPLRKWLSRCKLPKMEQATTLIQSCIRRCLAKKQVAERRRLQPHEKALALKLESIFSKAVQWKLAAVRSHVFQAIVHYQHLHVSGLR